MSKEYPRLKAGDKITCWNIDDMVNLNTELEKEGIHVDFEVNKEAGIYRLVVTGRDDES